MKAFQVIKSNNKFGLIKTDSKEVLLPYVYDSIENHFDEYFYVTKSGHNYVLDNKGDIIFDLKNEVNQHEFSVIFGVYEILCIEAKQDELTLYGENIDRSIHVGLQVCQLTIKDKLITPKMMSKETYVSKMNAETGFNVDFKN